MDYCPGGELFTMIKKLRRISEEKYIITLNLVVDFMLRKYFLL
jgi:hypothetical protein